MQINSDDGMKRCFICGDTVALGQYFTFHLSDCLTTRREYKGMAPLAKQQIVNQVENYFHEYLPGTIFGYGE